MAQKDEYQVDGYLFISREDRDLALEEKQKIDYFEEKTKGKNKTMLLNLYDSILDQKLFKTPVGLEYLRKLREELIADGYEESQIRPIPLYRNYSYKTGEEIDVSYVKRRVKPSDRREKKAGYLQISVCFNLLLTLLVITMFVITMKSDNPNILNYKKQILNEYASWEQELTERENRVREKEQELSMEAPVILDVMMPKMDGWQTCREIRQYSKVPIIMLTARSDEKDELQGFQLGVDEYISKPFSPKILVARVEAILRRTGQTESEDKLSMGGIVLDKEAHSVTIDGKEIELSYKEFELLAYFMENKGIALSREKILNNVWNYDYFGDARTIDTHVKKLRSKMGEKGDLIKTIWGMGYKFEV